MPTPEQVRAAVDGYTEALAAGELERWLDCFATDAVVVDPVPSDPHKGRDAIAEFWAGMTGMADELRLERHATHVCGDQAAMVYTLTLLAAGGGMAFDGVEIFTVDGDGRIVAAQAYWDPSELRRVDPDAG